jgi:patatin-like phospholipase/acyl hydrolase
MFLCREAGRATSAAPVSRISLCIWSVETYFSAIQSYFPPIKLKDEHGQSISYIDGGLGHNNPSKELLYEAREVFGPDHPIGCFISIGTGRDKNIALNDVRKLHPAYSAFRAVALGSEKAHSEMEQFFSRKTDVYFRLV